MHIILCVSMTMSWQNNSSLLLFYSKPTTLTGFLLTFFFFPPLWPPNCSLASHIHPFHHFHSYTAHRTNHNHLVAAGFYCKTNTSHWLWFHLHLVLCFSCVCLSSGVEEQFLHSWIQRNWASSLYRRGKDLDHACQMETLAVAKKFSLLETAAWWISPSWASNS